MMTGTLKSQIDRIWDTFWSGGISNPMEVIEQMTYLLFIKRLDEEQKRREKKAARSKVEVEDPIFNKRQQKLRWSKFKELGDPAELYRVVSEDVFPFIKTLGGHGGESAYARHMKDARFTIPTPGLLAKVVDMIDDVPMDDRDTKGDLYEYMLGKIASAGQNGQFRTPRHIIKLMVDMMAPTPEDTICDPACGTAGFLVAAAEYLRDHHGEAIYKDRKSAKRFNADTFHGFDFDSTMLRVGAMNMLLHGIEQPSIENRDSLSEGHAGVAGQYSLILANPPFAGSLDYESTAKDLLQIVKTKKTELLFLALFLRLLKPGGRAAVIVPDGVLFGSSKAHKELRRMLVEDQRLDGIVSMPSGVFRPYAGVSTAILLFTKTDSGGTDKVWFYDMQADGYSLDDKRNPLLPDNKLGTSTRHSREGGNPVSLTLTPEEHAKNNLPDILKRWNHRKAEAKRERTEQSFLVPKAEIAGNDYDLSINRYKQVVHAAVQHAPPKEIIAELQALEAGIAKELNELEGMIA